MSLLSDLSKVFPTCFLWTNSLQQGKGFPLALGFGSVSWIFFRVWVWSSHQSFWEVIFWVMSWILLCRGWYWLQ